MRILIQSDRTGVPRVTAGRSPPDSRMTGADSPVIADSSTDATPSMISPSDGMNSPALTITTSSFRSAVAGTISNAASTARLKPDTTGTEPEPDTAVPGFEPDTAVPG